MNNALKRSEIVEPVTAAYIHVPFCIHRCGYCDFTVIANRDDLQETYLDCLQLELERTFVEPQWMRTLFIGGGTPNSLPAKLLERLLKLLQQWLPVEASGEISIECNPEDFTTEQMSVMTEFGINRVSLGVQSFHSDHLQTLERGHRPETVEDVVLRLRELGFENLSFDLIYAVPGQSLMEWQATLQRAIALDPQHISTYGLTYEKGTSFWSRRLKEKLLQTGEELERAMYAASMDSLSTAGFTQYELSNFARPGFQCQHNQVYWEAKPYWGFGPGAASFLQGVRATRHRSVTGWIKLLKAGQSPIAAEEKLEPLLATREAIMLGLRQTAGIDLAVFEERFECPLRDLAPEAYDDFLVQGLLEIEQGKLRLSRAGRFLADTVVAEFL